MRKNKRKLTACALTIMLGLSYVVYPVHAEETQPTEQTGTGELLELDETAVSMEDTSEEKTTIEKTEAPVNEEADNTVEEPDKQTDKEIPPFETEQTETEEVTKEIFTNEVEPTDDIADTAEQVQKLIDNLPTAEELNSMSLDEQNEVYSNLQTAYDAYNALTDEEKAQITGAGIFDSLFEMFNSMVNTLATVNGVSYLDASGNKKTQNNVTVVDKNTTTWNAGWYVVNKGVAIDTRITVSGTVNLILADGYTLDAKSGIDVPENSHLLIYAQSTGGSMGVLNATGSGSALDAKAGIGGGPCGSITINGGKITANANQEASEGFGAAGIGGNHAKDVKGTITINGGEVAATGGGIGYGIGASWYGATGGTIIINGGSVYAQSGIAKDTYGTCGMGGAGGTQIILNGGVVVAEKRTNGGYGVEGDFSANGNGVIFTDGFSSSDPNSWKGIIFQGTSGKVYGTQTTIDTSFEIPGGYTLENPTGTTLVVPNGVTINNLGSIANNGTIDLRQGGKITGNPPTGSGTILYPKAPTPTVTIDTSKTTASSITVTELENKDTYGGAEYSFDGHNWQTSNVLTDLHSNTAYTVYARYKGNNDGYSQSDAGKIENISTKPANYTITIPAEPVEAGNSESKAELKPSNDFDLGYNGTAMVKVKKDSGVDKDGKLTLTRQNDTENHTIASALLVNGTALGNISNNVATFTMNNKESVSVSFDSPTSESGTIPAGTYNGTIIFEVSYSEP